MQAVHLTLPKFGAVTLICRRGWVVFAIIRILFEIAEHSWWKVVESTLSFLPDETLVASFCLMNQQQQTEGVSQFSASRAALRYIIFWLCTFQMLNQHAPPLSIHASETLGSISFSSYLQNAKLWSWDRGLFRQSGKDSTPHVSIQVLVKISRSWFDIFSIVDYLRCLSQNQSQYCSAYIQSHLVYVIIWVAPLYTPSNLHRNFSNYDQYVTVA